MEEQEHTTTVLGGSLLQVARCSCGWTSDVLSPAAAQDALEEHEAQAMIDIQAIELYNLIMRHA